MKKRHSSLFICENKAWRHYPSVRLVLEFRFSEVQPLESIGSDAAPIDPETVGLYVAEYSADFPNAQEKGAINDRLDRSRRESS